MHANHYHGRHSSVYCGRLRNNVGVCSSFQLLQLCDAAVSLQLLRALTDVVVFVSTHDVILDLRSSVPAHLQAALRIQFGLPPHP